ncbi:MAG: hypothetical protein ACLFXM_05865 [Acidimicrobiia bacterium]
MTAVAPDVLRASRRAGSAGRPVPPGGDGAGGGDATVIDEVPGELTRWLAGVTAAAALTETVLLRLATRTAIHIPGIEQVATPYGVFASIGRFAHYAASLLVAVTLALLAGLLVRRGHPVAAAAVGLVVVAAAAARVGLVSDVALALAAGAGVAGLVAWVVRAGSRRRVPVALAGVAFVAAAIHATAQHLSGAGALRPHSTAWLLLAAEAVVLAAVLVLPLVVRVRRRDLLVGAAAGGLVLAVFTANTATSTILLLWTFGLAGYVPAAVYAVAAGVLVAVLRALAREHRDLAVSLALVALGGIGLHSSYQTALVVCGLALLVATETRWMTTSSRTDVPAHAPS